MLTFAAPLLAQDGPDLRFAPSADRIEFATEALTPRERQFVDTHPELRVAIDPGEYPPYIEISPDGDYGGHVVDLLDAVADIVGFRLVPVVYESWPAVLDAVREREADIALLAAYTPEREAYLDYVPGVFPDPTGLISRSGETRFDEDETLDGVRVGVGIGFAEEQLLETLYPRAVAVPMASLPGAVRSLANGTIDLYLGPILAIAALAERRGDLTPRVVQRVYSGAGGTQIVSRSDRPMIARLLGRFIGDGRDRVVEKVVGGVDSLTANEIAPLSLSAEEAARLDRYDTLRVGALSNLPMLNGVNSEGTHTGIAADFTAYLSYEFGLPVEVVRYASFAELMDGAERDEIDLIPLLAPGPDNAQRFSFSAPYFETPWVLIGHQEEPYAEDLSPFAGGRVGLIRGNPMRAALERDNPGVEIVGYRTQRDMLQAVVRRDIDAAIMTRLIALPLLNLSFAGELHVLGSLEERRAPFAFAAPARSAELVPLIDRALAQMDPALADRIVRRWTAVDFEPTRRLQRLLRILVPAAIALALLSFAVLWWNRRIAAESVHRRLAEQRLVDMTEGLRTGVFQLRQCGRETPRFVFSNALAKEMARLPADHDGVDSHERFVAHIHPDERIHIGERMKHALASGESFREAFRFAFPWNPDGWVLAEATPRPEADGSVLWNGHLFDLSGERRLSENLGELLAAKEEFVAAAGHELRTPAQNVSLALDSLGRTDLPPAAGERLRAARQAAGDLEALVGDLLDIGHMDAHELTLREVPLELPELLRAASRTFAAALEEKGLAFECRIDEDVPAWIEADPVRLRQILYNVVGNAVKYTDRGSVTLRALRGTSAPEADVRSGNPPPGRAGVGTEVVIEVEDTGIGIPASHLEAIFEPFSTVGPLSRRSTGLGLAICNRLVAVMGGRFEVDSEPDRGSTFRIRLPVMPLDAEHGARDPDATGSEWRVGTSMGERGERRVLLVDDDRFVRVTLAALLRQEGFEVEEAGDAERALRHLETGSFTAVVTDYRMPGMSGVDLALAVRQRERPHHERPALVGMTGGMAAADAGRARDAFDVLLIKPVNALQIRQAIESVRVGDESSRGPSARAVARAPHRAATRA